MSRLLTGPKEWRAMSIAVTPDFLRELKQAAKDSGFDTVSSFVRVAVAEKIHTDALIAARRDAEACRESERAPLPRTRPYDLPAPNSQK